jgi:hypothetical protein
MSKNIVFHTNVVSRFGLWTPADITTTAWYDAADADTITESGGSVSAWDDKSGNLRHVLQDTGAKQPTYNLTDTVTFDGVDDFLGNGSPFMYDNGEISVFLVNKIARNPTTENLNILAEGRSSDSAPAYVPARLISGDMGVAIRTDNNTWLSANPATNLGNAFVENELALNHWKDDGSTLHARKNGGTETSAVYDSPRGPSITLDLYTLGAVRVGAIETRHWDGDINEVVVCNNLSESDRQKVEGYLAWKWGLVGDLPIGHPYKENPPHG